MVHARKRIDRFARRASAVRQFLSTKRQRSRACARNALGDDAVIKPQGTSNIRVLLVEDDVDVSSSLTEYLGALGCDVVLGIDDSSARQLLIETQQLDVAIIDLGLPRGSGLELIRYVRSAGMSLPLIVLTAEVELNTKVLAFEIGADDYVVKPCAGEELFARIKAVLRRAGDIRRGVLTVGALHLDLDRQSATYGSTELNLTPAALGVLHMLMHAAPNVVARRSLLRRLGREFEEEGSSLLRTQIWSIRRALKAAGAGGMLVTVHGTGYRLRGGHA